MCLTLFTPLWRGGGFPYSSRHSTTLCDPLGSYLVIPLLRKQRFTLARVITGWRPVARTRQVSSRKITNTVDAGSL